LHHGNRNCRKAKQGKIKKVAHKFALKPFKTKQAFVL
jgi:hypothetical protein